MRVRFTARAEADIVDGYLYGYRTFGEAQAERYEQDLRRVIGLIADNPRIAPERPDTVPPVRIHHHAKHYIVYVIEDGGILVVRVLRDEVDLTRQLGPKA